MHTTHTPRSGVGSSRHRRSAGDATSVRHVATRRCSVGAAQVTDHSVHTAVAISISGLLPVAIAQTIKALQPRRCNQCLGTGFLICPKCQGRGKQGLTLPGEPRAHAPCQACSRKGRCSCTSCSGCGLANSWLWQPASDPGWGPRGS